MWNQVLFSCSSMASDTVDCFFCASHFPSIKRCYCLPSFVMCSETHEWKAPCMHKAFLYLFPLSKTEKKSCLWLGNLPAVLIVLPGWQYARQTHSMPKKTHDVLVFQMLNSVGGLDSSELPFKIPFLSNDVRQSPMRSLLHVAYRSHGYIGQLCDSRHV